MVVRTEYELDEVGMPTLNNARGCHAIIMLGSSIILILDNSDTGRMP